jgi:hypothetical protein
VIINHMPVAEMIVHNFGILERNFVTLAANLVGAPFPLAHPFIHGH